MRRFISVLLIKKIIVFFVLGTFLVPEQKTYAQALPVANFVVNRAVGGVIEKMAIARGVAANDPMISATFTGVGAATTSLNVASTVAGVAFAVAGAPVWMGIAASLGLIAFGYGIKVWFADSNGKPEEAEIKVVSSDSENVIEIDMPPEVFPSYPGPGVSNSDSLEPWIKASRQGAPIYRSPGCYPDQACYSYPSIPKTEALRYEWFIPYSGAVLLTQNIQEFGRWYVFIKYPNYSYENGPTITFEFTSIEVLNNESGSSKIKLSYRETRSTVPPIPGYPNSGSPGYSRIVERDDVGNVLGKTKNLNYRSLDHAANNLPKEINDAKVSDETLARLINEIWRRAAMAPDYKGIPYSVGQPVTASDVRSWTDSNPAQVPRVRDMFQPANYPDSRTVPISPKVRPDRDSWPEPQPQPRPEPRPIPRPDDQPQPYPQPGSGKDVNVVNTPNVNVKNKVKVDLGDDPGMDAPELERTPTAQEIFKPILDSLKSLTNYQTPAHASECPKPTFDFFEKTLVLTSHCDLLDAVKPTLFAVMAAVWVVVGVLIVLGA